MPWGAIAGAVISGVGSAASAHAAGVKNDEALNKAKGWLKIQKGLSEFTSKQQIGLAQKNVGLINKGYANAKANIAGSGYAAKQAVTNAGTQANAQISQGLLGSGLYNSSIKGNLDQAQFYKTSQALGGVDEAIGQMLAGLDKETAAAKASANDALGGAYQNAYSNQASALGQISSLYTGQQFIPAQYNFGGLGDALGKIIQSNKKDNQAIDWANGAQADYLSQLF